MGCTVQRPAVKRAGGSGTLPDLLRVALDVMFVGINPSLYSVQQGHYFARPSNRFWPCLSRSVLSAQARLALKTERLMPCHDRLLTEHGIGFTDVVKRATVKASELTAHEMAAGMQRLVAKIERYRPRVACFHGVTGYRFLHRTLTCGKGPIRLGPQGVRVGLTALYVLPNPSGANAHFSRDEQTDWYDRLAGYLIGPST
jgi:double-stranded uracil-DNA glycosylase